MVGRSLRVIMDEHATLASILKSAGMLGQRGPGKNRSAFFEAMRAMLLYMDEFPEKLHHPKETELLFPQVVRVAPETEKIVARLDKDHEFTERSIHDLMRHLVGWEMVGESRREKFISALNEYIELYLQHMRIEEDEILSVARKRFNEADWEEIDSAFEENKDWITGHNPPDKEYEELFQRIVYLAPSPIGSRSE